MKKKNIVLAATVAVCIVSTSIIGFFCLSKNNDNLANTDKVKQTSQIEANKSGNLANKKDNNAKKNINQTKVKEKTIKKAHLYSDASSSAIPLSAIAKIADLPVNIQNIVANIANDNNIFMVQKNNNKLIIISDNPDNIRHNIEFTEVSIDNGHQTQTALGYNGTMQDSDNDIWDYDSETHQPIKHTKYNKEGDVEYMEVWNYAPEEPIKYEMKDGNAKVISLRKETLQNGTDLRVEHLVYDKDGNTKINVSITYEGEDIKRFTYYNADKPSVSGSIFSDYEDGLKIKETVYTSDLKPQETYTSEYKDGLREDIVIWNNKNQEVQKLLSDG